LSRTFNLPNRLLLLLSGLCISAVKYNGEQLIRFSQLFLNSIAVITLAIVAFDSASKLKLRKFDTISSAAFKLSIASFLLNIVLLSAASFYLFRPMSILLAVIFAAVISGTDLSAIAAMFSGTSLKLFELLKTESVFNTSFVVLVPMLLISIISNAAVPSAFLSKALLILQHIIAGIGTGVLIAVLFFKFMKKYYSQILSPLAMLSAALLAYAGAESIGGNGILAVAAAGIIFGNMHLKHAKDIQEFKEVLSKMLEIIVFILIGSIVKGSRNISFLVSAIFLFLIFISIRFIAVNLSLTNLNYSLKEKLYLTLNIPKGIAVAAVIFALATKPVAGIDIVLNLIILFTVFSVTLSVIVIHFTKFFAKYKGART